jgi:apolipoprotein N-acyltransferase
LFAAGLAGRRPRRRFAPRQQAPSPFWCSPTVRVVLLPLLGALTATALPPNYILLSLAVGFSGLLLSVRESKSAFQAVGAGWLFGFGFFLAGLYWMGNSFMVDAERYGWLAVPAVVGLSAALAVFPALAAVGTRLLSRAGIGELVALAASWVATEWLRGVVLTGFPWNLIGYVWTVSDQTLQGAALVGIYGLSFVTVLFAAAPAVVWGSSREEREGVRWLPVWFFVLFPAALWGFGELRLQTMKPVDGVGPRLRIVQGNVPQAQKWQPAQRESIIRRYLALTAQVGAEDIAIRIWPETALPVDLNREVERRRAVADVISEGGVLLAGSVRYPQDAGATPQPRNSLLAISESGDLLAIYDKVRLVPFGEYVPLQEVLPLEKLVSGRGSFVPGMGPTVVKVPGVPPFQPLICYEAIFPGWMPREEDLQAQWILNVTNDAWFGESIGPYQHFQMARTRAVERGIPLVRAANTGISAIIDPLGRVSARLELGETGVLDAVLPAVLSRATPYSRYGEGGVILLVVAAAGASVVTRRLAPSSRNFRRK